MNSKQCAKLAFGNPGFFDFLAPVTNLVKQISPAFQLIDIAKKTTGVDVQQLAATKAPVLGKVIDIAETVSGGAIGASGIAAGAALLAPAVASVSLPSLGSLSTLGGGSGIASQIGNLVQADPTVTDQLLDGSDDSDPFSDAFDEDDAGPDEE